METHHRAVKTFTCRYDALEDRLLLTLNYQSAYERVDFWITRRFLLKLVPVFFDFTEHMPVQETYVPYASQNTGETEVSEYLLFQRAPILLESVDFQKREGHIVLLFKNHVHQIVYEAILDAAGVERFVNLLLGCAPRYEWGEFKI